MLAFSECQSSFLHTLMRSPTTVGMLLLLMATLVGTTSGFSTDEPALEDRFDRTVRPFVQMNCLGCHGPDKPNGKLDLSVYTSVASIIKDFKVVGASVRSARCWKDAAGSKARCQPDAPSSGEWWSSGSAPCSVAKPRETQEILGRCWRGG